jgi:hypothetical protein
LSQSGELRRCVARLGAIQGQHIRDEGVRNGHLDTVRVRDEHEEAHRDPAAQDAINATA